MTQTQPKPGTLHGTDSNPTKRTGRGNGSDGSQKEPGYEPGTSKNPTPKGGTVPDGQNIRGYDHDSSSPSGDKSGNPDVVSAKRSHPIA